MTNNTETQETSLFLKVFAYPSLGTVFKLSLDFEQKELRVLMKLFLQKSANEIVLANEKVQTLTSHDVR